jgi:hypothetical protein
MKKTYLRKIGPIGEANLRANKDLTKIWKEKGIVTCEIGLPGCLKIWALQNVHRHKRSWYRPNLELLSDFKQVLRGCTVCHQTIENDEELTDDIFMKIRGPEML